MQQQALFDEITLITPTAPMSPGHPWRAREMPAAPDAAGPAGADDGRAVLRCDPRHRPRPDARPAADPDAVRRCAVGVGPALEPGPGLGRAERDPQYRDEPRRATPRSARRIGETAATGLYLRFVQCYAVQVARLDPEPFHLPDSRRSRRAGRDAGRLRGRDRRGVPGGLSRSSSPRCCARWRVPGRGPRRGCCVRPRGRRPMPASGWWCSGWRWASVRTKSGSGVIQFVSRATGEPQITGRYLSQSQGREALSAGSGAIYLTRDPRGRSLEELCPDVFAELARAGEAIRTRLREEMQIEFTMRGRAALHPRCGAGGRAARGRRCRIAVALAEDGVIPTEEAVMRVDPQALSELLHRQVDPGGGARPHRLGHRGEPRRGVGADRPDLGRGAGLRRAGRGLHPGPARDQPRGHPRHDRRQGGADDPRRGDQPCRGDRPRPRPALRRRRLGPGDRPQEAAAGLPERPASGRGRGDHRRRHPRARCWPARRRCSRRRSAARCSGCWAGPTRCATSACAPTPTRRATPRRRATSSRRASASAGPSTCSSRASGSA